MDCCNKNKTQKERWESIKKIPSCRYLKDPAYTINDLYNRYPDGGEYGWFSFIESTGNFAVWNKEEKKWEIVGSNDQTYTLYSSVNTPAMGGIEPSGISTVKKGNNIRFLFYPKTNYILRDIELNGKVFTPVCDYYDIENISENIQITANFIPDPDGDKMYYGYLKQAETGNITDYSSITKSMLENSATIFSELPQKLDRKNIGKVPEGCFIIIAIPESAALKAYKDNGFGSKTTFDASIMGSNGTEAKFDGVMYKLYGEFSIAPGERFIYIN